MLQPLSYRLLQIQQSDKHKSSFLTEDGGNQAKHDSFEVWLGWSIIHNYLNLLQY